MKDGSSNITHSTPTALQWMPFRPCCSEVAVRMCCVVLNWREAGSCLGPQQGMKMELPSWQGKQTTSCLGASGGHLGAWDRCNREGISCGLEKGKCRRSPHRAWNRMPRVLAM